MKIFRRNKSKEPEISNLYVVDAGTYGGDYLVLMDTDILRYHFLVLPDMIKRDIEKEIFNEGIKNKVVKFIEKLPSFVFNTCKSQYATINKEDGLRETN